MLDIEAWRNSNKTIEKSKRYYAHFDYRTDLTKCWDYISDPQNISKHGFYPFIHYVKNMDKYSSAKGRNPKPRDICYASHIDRCIFQYYNFILNELYNERCQELDINNVAVAYRTNLTRKSNIHFAKTAIDFIRNSDDCFVMIGDFTKFFDRLCHKYLKKQWCDLLRTPTLPKDHFAVFKNITRYSKIELSDLLKLHNLKDNSKGRKELNSKKRILFPDELHKKICPIIKNSDFGIPQGSPMSGVLANVYMLEVDKILFDYISSLNGIYMRYSDDFVVILPHIKEEDAIRNLIAISDLFNSPDIPGLELQQSKTQYYYYYHHNLINCGAKISNEADCSNRFLNFLGFTFDGKKVSLRAKTVSKYYQRMRRKAKTVVKNGGFTKNKTKISKKNLYMKYSERGMYGKTGNFLTYAMRAEDQFGKDELISLLPKRNMYKIRKFLKKDYSKSKK